MFDTIAILLSSIPSFVFPVFASYKALKTSDPALLAPWLMYWVVLAIFLLVESWLGFILFWIPFYGYARLIFHLYLVLPQIQGATYLYQAYIHPWLCSNELAIDDFICSAHDRAKAAGVVYIKQLIDYVKHNVLNFPREPTPPPTPAPYGYAQSLFARFSLPSARAAAVSSGVGVGVGDFYTLLAGAVSTGSGTQRDAGSLIPTSMQGAERMTFITAQRERLSILLSALDREASNLQSNTVDTAVEEAVQSAKDRPKSSMSSRKSEPDFEKIAVEEAAGEISTGSAREMMGTRNVSSNWMPWSWGSPAKEKSEDDVAMKDSQETAKGLSTGVDAL